jgi:hypothetical protein
VQEILIGRVAQRLDGHAARAEDPRPAAIVGAAFACMQAARSAWFASDQSGEFGAYIDDAMSAVTIQQ